LLLYLLTLSLSSPFLQADDVAKLEKDVERIIADNDRGISEKDREMQALQDAADQESLELKQDISHYKEELEKARQSRRRPRAARAHAPSLPLR